MILENKKIAIVGGGPGGLTLAKLLQQRGVQVHVYERDTNKDVRVQGATLDLHEESGLAALREAGLTDAFYANYRPDAGKMRVAGMDKTIYLDDHALKNGYADQRPEIDRGPLRKILLESLQPETVVWDCNFLSMEAEGEGWRLFFKNETSVYADIVVAADGANSRIRKQITDITPVYSGVTIVEGNVYNARQNAPGLYEMVKGGKVFAFGDEQSLILSAKGDGSLSFYTGCKVPEDWSLKSGIEFTDQKQVHQWFAAAFRSWDSSWQELFSGEEVWCMARPQYHYPLDQSWTALPNLTMLGDAAHRMPPYAGEGVNMAMLDALELAECLTSDRFDDLAAAIACYEKNMLERTAEVTRITLQSTEMLHSVDAIDQMLAMMQRE